MGPDLEGNQELSRFNSDDKPTDLQSCCRLWTRAQAFVSDPWAMRLAFLWGLAEATVFFIVPDVYLGFVALLAPRRSVRALAWTVAGALVGGSILYWFGASNPHAATSMLAHIPLIDPVMIAEVGRQTEADGAIAVMKGPLSGIPYKIFAAQAGSIGVSFFQFLILSIPGRLERMLPVVLACALAGRVGKDLVRQKTPLVLGAYLGMWALIYLGYVARLR